MSQYRFAWRSSYLGCVSYDVFGDGAQPYELEVRVRANDFHRSIYNGTSEEFDREVVALIGYVMRRPCPDPLSPELVKAFNDWREQKHRENRASMDAQPERYGDLTDFWAENPPPPRLKGAKYERGVGLVQTCDGEGNAVDALISPPRQRETA